MKGKVVVSLGLLVLVMVLVFLYLKRDQPLSPFIVSIGKDYNRQRLKCGIPIIEDDWIMHDYDSSEIFWSNANNRVNTTEPVHLSKTIGIHNDIVKWEEDDFHFETKESIAYRLVCRINFYQHFDTVSYRLIKYFKESYPPTVSFNVDRNFADSTLLNWGFETKYNGVNCQRELVFFE